jgi:hypothetical protein
MEHLPRAASCAAGAACCCCCCQVGVVGQGWQGLLALGGGEGGGGEEGARIVLGCIGAALEVQLSGTRQGLAVGRHALQLS